MMFLLSWLMIILKEVLVTEETTNYEDISIENLNIDSFYNIIFGCQRYKLFLEVQNEKIENNI